MPYPTEPPTFESLPLPSVAPVCLPAHRGTDGESVPNTAQTHIIVVSHTFGYVTGEALVVEEAPHHTLVQHFVQGVFDGRVVCCASPLGGRDRDSTPTSSCRVRARRYSRQEGTQGSAMR